MPWLLHSGSRIQLSEGETVVGAAERADARVAASGLAPRHFTVVLKQGHATVRACSLDSIVTLNGEQLDAEACPLTHGDTIGAGRGWFVFLEREDPAAAARPVRPSKLGAAAEAWLVDESAGIAYSLSGGAVGIGRDPSNAVSLAAATASRFHAQVRREAGGLVLHPAGSSGTWLNGTRLGTPMLLSEGDELEIAGVRLRVMTGSLPTGIVPAAASGAATADQRRPTIQRMTPLSADATRFQAPSRLWLVLTMLVVLAIAVGYLTR